MAFTDDKGTPAQVPDTAQGVWNPNNTQEPYQGFEPETVDQRFRGTAEYFDPNKSTVQGQLQGLLDESNPLMQRAKTKALQQSQSRGLLNSSLASSAGQAAMYEAAMPIAQADAKAYNERGMVDAQYDIDTDVRRANERFQEQFQQKELDADQMQWLSNMFQDSTNNWATNMTRIMVDPNLTASDKASIIQQGQDWINSSISTLADLNGFNYEL